MRSRVCGSEGILLLIVSADPFFLRDGLRDGILSSIERGRRIRLRRRGNGRWWWRSISLYAVLTLTSLTPISLSCTSCIVLCFVITAKPLFL